MKTTLSALLIAGLSVGALAACGAKHDILGSRTDGGGPSGGTAGSAGQVTGGTGAAGGSGGTGGSTGGGTSGGAGGGAGLGAGANGTGGAGGGQAGTGDTGGAGAVGGTSGSGGSGGSGDAGATNGGTGGGSGEAGASTGGTAGAGAGGTGGASPMCPSDCTPGTAAGCGTSQIGWSCGNGFDNQEFLDGGCTDQGTSLPRFCCPQDFYADCRTPCAEVSTLDACEARTDCHSVFTDPNTCGCAAIGCCARFARCAEGNLANCVGPVDCAAATPFCDDPAYVVSYANGCFEGCVKPADCATQ